MSHFPIGKVRYHPRETLVPKAVARGFEMWSVALSKTLLTCFKIAPHCDFVRHSHLSEQITMVLEGKLFFKVEDDVFCVESGEVLAIPSRVPHSAFTKDRAAAAVGAWSPVLARHRKIDPSIFEIEGILSGGAGMKP